MRQTRKLLPLTSSLSLSFAACFLFLLAGCHPAAKPPVAAAPPTATKGAPVAPLKSPSGKTYARSRVGPADDDEPVTIPAVAPGAAPNMDTFRGSARACAKLSIASGAPQSFTDIGDVLDSLPSDESMRAMDIPKTADSCRLAEEQKMVTVTAFLYAASRESDNDFHCIVGRDPSLPSRFMNVEVSGLPPSGSQFLAAMRAARNQFKAFFTANGDALPGSGYDKFDPPISITVTGSLFFDVDHVPPAVGPTGMKPQTAWEIHPVSVIQFETQN